MLVNNAGVLGPRVPIEEYPEGEWRRVIDANLTGPFLVTKAAIPHMPEGGSIINVVSGVSVEGRAGGAPTLSASSAWRGSPRSWPQS